MERLRNCCDQPADFTVPHAKLTLATFASVAASVTSVGCITLWTVKLNIGSTRFLETPSWLEALVSELSVDLIEPALRCRVNASLGPVVSCPLIMASDNDLPIGTAPGSSLLALEGVGARDASFSLARSGCEWSES